MLLLEWFSLPETFLFFSWSIAFYIFSSLSIFQLICHFFVTFFFLSQISNNSVQPVSAWWLCIYCVAIGHVLVGDMFCKAVYHTAHFISVSLQYHSKPLLASIYCIFISTRWLYSSWRFLTVPSWAWEEVGSCSRTYRCWQTDRKSQTYWCSGKLTRWSHPPADAYSE